MARIFTITEGLENLGALKTGGQGSVYKGKRMGEIITAVKLLPTPIYSESQQDKHYIDFQNEVQKLKKVNEVPNPNVVKILSYGITETGGFPFIEMEFIEGPDLEELLQPPNDPVFTIKETIKVAEQLAHALAHCHKVNVKHGDVKSNNVKFNVHTGNYVLLDFGLAIMSDEQRRTSLRHAGAVEFMAPEQHEGQMLFQSDVYSFGIILFELLAGTVPFPLKDNGETSRNAVMLAHIETTPPDILPLRQQHLPATWSEEKKRHEMQVPEWLLHLIKKCLDKQPQNRFANGVALYEYVVHNSVLTENKNEWSAEQVQLLQQENETLRREKEQLQQLLIASKQRSQQQPVEAPEQPRKKSATGSIIATIFVTVLLGAVIYFALNYYRAKPTSSATPTHQVKKPAQVIGQYKVVAPRAYFHNEPDPSTRRSAYMIPSNDVVTATDEKNGFIYTEFTNNQGQTSKGWLRKQDLVTLDEWNRNNKFQEEARPTDQDIAGQLREAKDLLGNNQIQEALYIYSYLAEQNVPEAMYQYGNLALQGRNNAINCDEAIRLLEKAGDKGYAPAKRTLGFLYIFAENQQVLQVSHYDRCSFKKDVLKGTQLLIQAISAGDSTARQLLEQVNAKRGEEADSIQ